MDKMREDFEAWAISCEMCTYLYDAEYRHQSTEWAWKAWQASRAALCVELPIKKSGVNILNDSFFSGHKSGFNDAIDQCSKAIESSGVYCK